MLYDDYHDYCALVEQLRTDAMDALFHAMHADNQRTAEQHRTIRMALEEAIEGISIVLASDEALRDTEPEEWLFCGQPRRKAHFNDNYYALLDEERRKAVC